MLQICIKPTSLYCLLYTTTRSAPLIDLERFLETLYFEFLRCESGIKSAEAGMYVSIYLSFYLSISQSFYLSL
jgi:hypothetical protein